MRKSLLTLVISFLWIGFTEASDPNYVPAMLKQLQAMDAIQTAEEAQAVSNAFQRISAANDQEWLPLYYAALTKTFSAFRFDVDKDKWFDEALELVKKANQLSPENSELTALQGFIMMGKVSVDPSNRGQTLSPQVMQLLGKAINQDRENPRAVSLMGQMELGMSQFFGTGPEKACGLARMSLELFAKEEKKLTDEYILPRWGKQEANRIISNCN